MANGSPTLLFAEALEGAKDRNHHKTTISVTSAVMER